MNFKRFMKSTIADIKEYVPGKSIEEIVGKYGFDKSKVIKLGSNENPLGPSPKVINVLMDRLARIHLYPESDAHGLRNALAGYVGFPVENVVVSGNGMDGVLDTVMRLFITEGSETVITYPTFSYYEIATRANGGTPVFVKREENYDINVADLIEKVTGKCKIIFICSPNNPSGNAMEEHELRRLLESVDCLVFLDHAYVEFAKEDLTGLVREYNNLIVGRTLSKAFGLAGLRIGYAVVPEWMTGDYMKVVTPFTVNTLAEAAGMAAIDDTEYLRLCIRVLKAGREQLTKGLSDICKVYPSEANFVMIDVAPMKAADVAEAMLRRGIIVRDCTSFRGAGDSAIRISAGTREQNDAVIYAIREILERF